MRKLRVAMIAPPWLALPTKGYGGIELVIQSLVEELQKLGVEVELFANGARKMKGVVTHSLYKKELFSKLDWPYYDAPLQIMQSHLEFALKKIETSKFDIIHDHNPYIGPVFFSLATRIKGIPPALHTFHGPPFSNKVTMENGQEDNRIQLKLMHPGNLYTVCISNTMAKHAPKELRGHMLSAVHNAIELPQFPFVKKKKDYFVTLARFTPDKGQHIAVRCAVKLKKQLRMAGTIAGIGSNRKLLFELSNPLSAYRQSREFRYYSDKILPAVLRHPRITYSGNLSGQKKMKFLSQAKALLFPIQWEEPFGMAVIEAMACGTPVIAMKRGAMPELIKHGVTGFLAKDEKEFCEYMQRIDEIDPEECRKSVEHKFAASTMAKAYLERYKEVIERAKKFKI